MSENNCSILEVLPIELTRFETIFRLLRWCCSRTLERWASSSVGVFVSPSSSLNLVHVLTFLFFLPWSKLCDDVNPDCVHALLRACSIRWLVALSRSATSLACSARALRDCRVYDVYFMDAGVGRPLRSGVGQPLNPFGCHSSFWTRYIKKFGAVEDAQGSIEFIFSLQLCIPNVKKKEGLLHSFKRVETSPFFLEMRSGKQNITALAYNNVTVETKLAAIG